MLPDDAPLRFHHSCTLTLKSILYIRQVARPAPASARAAGIIAFLTAHPSRGFTISELVTHLSLNIASAHATLAVLDEVGFVVRDPVHRTYRLGPALAATGFAVLEQHPAIPAAIEQAEILAGELGVEATVTAVAGRDVIFLARRGPVPRSPGVGYPGDRSPLLAPIGAVFMAWAAEKDVAAWLDRAGASGPLAAFYRSILAEARARGYTVPMPAIAAPAAIAAVKRVRADPGDEAAERHLADVLLKSEDTLLPLDGVPAAQEIVFETLAAPIFDPIGRALLSLCLTGPEHPVPVEQVLAYGRRLVQAATIATRQARGRAPGDESPFGPTA
ncbi:helix-turn-helix domain-containing protein [Cryptosporangium sp. NPDC048952]|uniref:helix-turn-helix domain-containing protein n=1 Tax=Cryptosporangium sp. NPDC048952 TaxID=3363961 RepID=UPI00371445E6